ncbi:MAG: hypothetical protein EXX96DRAFT_565277 [Benjaminiella poitrasii]|nr:MAG: hypothetical protein EXX96DRAFT_565277 [Benjaminiella poitrasii]
MPSEKFRINTNGQSLRNPNNAFFDMTLSANLTLDESDASANIDRRNAHNALERQRRELLNVKFQQLAHALPSLQTIRRPSKTMIVAKSLEFVSSSMKRESKFTSEIQKLRLENEKLRRQAQVACSQLKQQLRQENDDDNESTIITNSRKTTQDTEAKDETKRPLKRKASSAVVEEHQLSPPLTPETATIASSEDNQKTFRKKKKKMLKQTRLSAIPALQPTHVHQQHTPLVTKSRVPMTATGPLGETTWTASINQQPPLTTARPIATSYRTTTTNNNTHLSAYYDITASSHAATTTTTAKNTTPTATPTATPTTTGTPYTSATTDNLIFMPSSNLYNQQSSLSGLSLQQNSRQPLLPVTQPQPQSNYQNMIHPMLLTPYYIPSSAITDNTTNHCKYFITIITFP